MPACSHFKLYRASWSKVRVSNILAAVIIPVHPEKWVRQSTTTGERSLRAGVPTDLISYLSVPGVGGFLQELTDEDQGGAVSLCGADVEGLVRPWFSNTTPSIHPWHQTLGDVSFWCVCDIQKWTVQWQRIVMQLLHFYLSNTSSLKGHVSYMRMDLLGYCRYQAS